MKKVIYLSIIIVLLVGAGYLGYLIYAVKKTPAQQNSGSKETPSFVIDTEKGPVQVANPRRSAAKIITPSDVVMKENSDYVISFFDYSGEKSFLISIMGTDISSAREKAENDFMQSLQITREQACQLKVALFVSAESSPETAGEDFGLSFCSSGKPFPNSSTQK